MGISKERKNSRFDSPKCETSGRSEVKEPTTLYSTRRIDFNGIEL